MILRARVDKDTWKSVEKKISLMKSTQFPLHEKDADALYRIIQCLKKNITVQQQMANADLGIKGFGYISMGINKMFPNSLIQGIVLLSNACLYTSMLCYQKIKQYYHRKHIKGLSPQVSVKFEI